MLKIATTQVWVNDQEEALAFYTDKLGMEVRADVTIVLMKVPGPPVFDADTAQAIRDLTAKGAASAIFLTTDEVYAEVEAMKARGVELVDEPQERPYGIDCSFRDPSGNHFRLTQLTEF
jgi:catechol 2,3-dioxygenase-like lactoylglutathione lyase family enzyme